jgi:hypothetical protein
MAGHVLSPVPMRSIDGAPGFADNRWPTGGRCLTIGS